MTSRQWVVTMQPLLRQSVTTEMGGVTSHHFACQLPLRWVELPVIIPPVSYH